MTPGPTIIRKCSGCLKSIKQHTINSGNTFGATHWTDGKREAPMLPDQPLLVMCPHCHVPLWIYELKTSWGSEQSELEDSREYEKPSLDDYFALIENGLGDPKKERYARLRAWWAGNDERRTSVGEIPLSPRETANVMAFAHALDESDANDLVMKAEAMRELGRFDDALSLLAKVTDESISPAVEIIKGLSEKHDPYVRKIHSKTRNSLGSTSNGGIFSHLEQLLRLRADRRQRSRS